MSARGPSSPACVVATISFGANCPNRSTQLQWPKLAHRTDGGCLASELPPAWRSRLGLQSNRGTVRMATQHWGRFVVYCSDRKCERRLMQTLRFDNTFVRELPIDPQDGPRRRQVHGALHSRAEPTPVCAPRLIAHSREVASLLGIDAADVASPAFAQVFAGNALLDGMQPYAANYGGHQFGQWAGQLGDAGRSRLAKRSARPASAGSCSSRARAQRRMPAAPTAALCCAPRFGSFYAARRCITSGCQPRAR